MNNFYTRADQLFRERKTSRRRFTLSIDMPYSSLGAYWNTDKLPPGDVIVALAEYLRTDLNYLVYGKKNPLLESNILREIVEFLNRFTDLQITEIFGAIKQYILMVQMIPDMKE